MNIVSKIVRLKQVIFYRTIYNDIILLTVMYQIVCTIFNEHLFLSCLFIVHTCRLIIRNGKSNMK